MAPLEDRLPDDRLPEDELLLRDPMELERLDVERPLEPALVDLLLVEDRLGVKAEERDGTGDDRLKLGRELEEERVLLEELRVVYGLPDRVPDNRPLERLDAITAGVTAERRVP